MDTEIWAQFLELLKTQINDRCLTYVEHLTCASMTSKTWVLCLPDRATLNFVESNLFEKLQSVLANFMAEVGKPCANLVLTLESEVQASPQQGFLFNSEKITHTVAPNAKKAAFLTTPENRSDFDNSDCFDVLPFVPDLRVREKSRLNARFTFDSFIKGDSNELAYCAAKAVAANPASSYNPLFIYGGVGLGKTHLMHAIGNEILETSNLRVLYKTSEEFTNEYMDALRNNRMQAFRDSMRCNCDVLLIDDIQFIAGKTETQKEFFNTFNDLQSANKQIVITSDKHPKEINLDIEGRMCSRFLSGLYTDIQLPEYETRLGIVHKKSHADHFYISDEVAQYIAAKVTSNVRELEGVLNRLKAAADIRKESIHLDLAKRLIEPFYQTQNVLSDTTVILERVSRFFGLSVDELLSKSRAKQYNEPRQIAMYLARLHTDLSWPQLGKIFHRDHTTIISGNARIKERLSQKDPELELIIKRLKEELFR